MLKILLGIIVIAFIFTGAGSFYANRSSRVAIVNGEPIFIKEYTSEYKRIMDTLRRQFGGKLNENLIKAMNIKQRAIDRLIEERIILDAAKDLGIRIPASTLAEAITRMPDFNRNGRFNSGKYRRVLAQNSMTPEEFEAKMRLAMITKILKGVVTSAASVSEEELRLWYNNNNAEIKIAYAKFSPKDFTDTPLTEDEISNYYETHKEDYKTKPERKARYAKFSPEDFIDSVKVEESEISEYYDMHPDEFQVEETVTARHILLKLDPDADPKLVEEKRKKALEIMEKAKAGEDFAELAKKFSEGPSASNGGYLGPFTRKDMVKPFSDVAFSLKPGEISKPVRTRFGWHIIKVEAHTPAGIKPYDKVKEEIRKKIALKKAKDAAYEKAVAVYEVSYEGDDLIKNAGPMHFKVNETDFFTEDKGPDGIPSPKRFAAVAFNLPLMDISEVTQLGDSYFLIQPIDQKPPRIPDLEEIKDKVAKDAKKDQEARAAQKAAQAFLDECKKTGNMKKAAQQAGIDFKETDFFKKNSPVPGIPVPGLAAEAFLLNTEKRFPERVFGDESKGYYVIGFLEKKLPDKKSFEKDKEAARKQHLAQKQEKLYNSWLEQLKKSSEIEVFTDRL